MMLSVVATCRNRVPGKPSSMIIVEGSGFGLADAGLFMVKTAPIENPITASSTNNRFLLIVTPAKTIGV